MFSPLVLDPLSTIFSPVVLDPMRRGIGRTIKIDPTDSLLLTGIGGGQQSQTVLVVLVVVLYQPLSTIINHFQTYTYINYISTK